MNKLSAVISREYKEVVKKKSFLIGTLITPVFMFLIIFLPALLIDRESKTPIEFTLVDLNSGLLNNFRHDFVGTLDDGRPLFIVDYIESHSDKIDSLKTALNAKIDNDDLNFYVVIPQDVVQTGYAERYAKKHGNFADIETVRRVISKAVIQERMADYNVPANEIATLTRDVNLDYKQVGPKGTESGGGGFLAQYLSGLAFVMIMFTSIMAYGQHLLRAVLEEKNTRIMEVLVSSLTPFQLMMGKILGLGAAGLTQMAIWGAMGAAMFFLGTTSSLLSGIVQNAQALSLSFFLSFAGFFVLGYFLFATLYCLLGSIVSSEKEVQQFVAPMSLLMVLPIILAMKIMQNPDASWVVALSYIPILTPTLMVLRASYTYVPSYQVLIGMGIMVISILVLGWITARIFRVGILMYGKRPTLPELVKWIKYK
jgi:ABC-2 type transport system permease protein